MRLFVFFLLVSLSLQAQFFAPVYSNSVAKNNLIVDYDFQNPTSYAGTGTSVASANGKNVPATLGGSPTFHADPGYVHFKAASANYLSIGDLRTFYPQVSSSTRSGAFTLSLWFNPTLANGVVVSDLQAPVGTSGYHTSDIEMVGGVLKFSVWDKPIIITSGTIALNTWHHVVLVYTGTKLNAYVDNTFVGSATYTRYGPAMASLTTGQYFGIGAADGTNMGSGAYGSFLLGDVKFYASALSAADVTNLYLAEESNYDLLFMVDGSKNIATYPDLAGLATTATNTAGVTYNVAAGGSLYFNGSNGYTDISFPLRGATTLTIEMWVKLTSMNGGMLFGFNLYDVILSNNYLGFNTAGGDVYGMNATQTTGFSSTWKHCIFIMNAGSVTSNKIYINGVQQSLAHLQGTILPGNATFYNGLARIGCWRWDPNYLQPMYVTKFKIYNRELKQAEITVKFNQDKARHGL
ncbi:MAG: laminin G domain-containing protein [Cytophagaceae bacterium]|nr:laminin G domain-containing protein [Cytophagaceae bacterium]MBP6093035.1 laminin G domain-containing protein [Cytophagaceae bacterium]